MDIKKTSKRFRDALQQGIYRVINPPVRGMIRIGITPNVVTTIGFLGNLAAAVLLCVAGYKCSMGEAADFSLIIWSGAMIIGFSLFDMLDGQVARLGNMSSVFGAMYDSVLDRYCELTTLGGIAYFLVESGYRVGALITMLALIGSVMVSYVRARAEGLGVECKIGFMQRPERVVVTALSLLTGGIVGKTGHDATGVWILIVAMGIIAVFANLTASARIVYSRKQLNSGK